MPFSIEPSTEIANRIDFAHLCTARGYKDAVEVGVDQGVFAREFLSRWPGHWLLLVDDYGPHREFPYDRTADLIVAAQALAEFHGRFRFVRVRSPEAIPFVQAFISPEFVYVDGSHEEADVAADLRGWWDVLPDHGMLSGHDWDDRHPGVKAAVEAFAREREIVVRVTGEVGFPASFYMYKTEPENLICKFFRDATEPNPHAAT